MRSIAVGTEKLVRAAELESAVSGTPQTGAFAAKLHPGGALDRYCPGLSR